MYNFCTKTYFSHKFAQNRILYATKYFRTKKYKTCTHIIYWNTAVYKIRLHELHDCTKNRLYFRRGDMYKSLFLQKWSLIQFLFVY